MLIDDLVLLPVTGPFKGLLFLARQIAHEAENILYNEETIRGTLLELELRLEDGSISQEEYAKTEEQLIERLNKALERKAAQFNTGKESR